LAENRHHLPRDGSNRSHGLPVLDRSRPDLATECVNIVHILCSLMSS
jgi:hypothetical protein